MDVGSWLASVLKIPLVRGRFGTIRNAVSLCVLSVALSGCFLDFFHVRYRNQAAGSTSLQFDSSTQTIQGQWTSTASASAYEIQGSRLYSLNTQLLDGRVLLTGGIQLDTSVSISTEIYDPTTEIVSSAAAIGTGRIEAAIQTLNDGRVLVAGGRDISTATDAVEIYDPLSDAWTAVQSLPVALYAMSAVKLTDGRILVAGGATTNVTLTSVYAFDPTTETWSALAPMNQGRGSAPAVLLSDGRVFVAGGIFQNGGLGGAPIGSCEIYDPTGNTWTTVDALNLGRTYFRLENISGDRVLAIGGVYDNAGTIAATATTEIYSVVGDVWTAGPSMSTGRYYHSSVVGSDGTVFIAGGATVSPTSYLKSVERFDPSNDTISIDGDMTQTRILPFMVEQPDLSIAVIGGYSDVALAGVPQIDHRNASTETWSTRELDQPTLQYRLGGYMHQQEDDRVLIFGGTGGLAGASRVETEFLNPTTHGIETGPSLSITHFDPAIVYFDDGGILIISGQMSLDEDDLTNVVEYFDPVAKTWTTKSPIPTACATCRAAYLSNGTVLVIGGRDINENVLDLTQIYDIANDSWSAGPPLNDERYQHSVDVLADGRVLVAGGQDGSNPVTTTELYDPSQVTPTWSLSGALNNARLGHKTVALSDRYLLAVGGRTDTAEIYDAQTGIWTSTGSMSNPRTSFALEKLLDGTVLAAGGSKDTGTSYDPLTTAEIFDPSNGTWTLTAENLDGSHYFGSSIRLRDGRVYVTGGLGSSLNVMRSYDIYASTTPVRITPNSCSAPYTYALEEGSGYLYASGYYVPNPSSPETARIRVQSADACQGTFTLTTN